MDYNFLKASDGNGNAVLAHIQSPRSIGATVIEVDSLANWPDEFIVTTGTLLGTGFLDPASITEMRGHINGTDIEIDSFEPGHTDAGNTAGQVAIVKQTTGWADKMVELAQVSHNDDGTIKSNIPLTRPRITTSIDDSNGNEIIKTPATASAVNEVTITNAATGNAPEIAATGGDTNIHLKLKGKGTGGVLPVNPYMFSAYRAAAWTDGNNAYAKVTFDTELFDIGSNYDTSNGRFTAPVTGYYFVTAAVRAPVNNGSAYAISIFRSGTEVHDGDIGAANSAVPPARNVSSLIYMTAGQYLEVFSYGTGGAGSTGQVSTYFQGYLVSV